MVVETNSAEETFALGYKMGLKASRGDVVCLEGDLGAGKTVFAQGYAKGLGIKEPISSPTFNIVQIYEGGRLPLYHFDVYRLNSVEEIYDVGFEEYFFGNGVCLIEWASIIYRVIPQSAAIVKIKKSLSKDYDYRRIEISRTRLGDNDDDIID